MFHSTFSLLPFASLCVPSLPFPALSCPALPFHSCYCGKVETVLNRLHMHKQQSN